MAAEIEFRSVPTGYGRWMVQRYYQPSPGVVFVTAFSKRFRSVTEAETYLNLAVERARSHGRLHIVSGIATIETKILLPVVTEKSIAFSTSEHAVIVYSPSEDSTVHWVDCGHRHRNWRHLEMCRRSIEEKARKGKKELVSTAIVHIWGPLFSYPPV